MRARRLARPVHVALGPGETLLPGTADAVAKVLEDARVEAVLLPIVPSGAGPLPRAARRYLRAWDARLLHAQNFFAPATRVATRAQVSGHRNADAAPALARALDEGRRIEALREGGVASPVARDLGAWVAWAREEGAAWGALAARDARFARFVTAPTRGAWAKHNVWRAPRRMGEVLEATRTARLLPVVLHATREAAFTGAAGRAYRQSQQS